MPKKDQYKHTCHTIVELSGDDVFELMDRDLAAIQFKRLQDSLKKSYGDGEKPEKLFIYMLATDDLENINEMIDKMNEGDDVEAGN